MKVKTAKLWFGHLLLLLLVTAFLTMPWASAHIHLSEQHAHDGSHHQHHSEAHVHNLTHQTAHASIIELAHECSFPKQKKQNGSAMALGVEATTLLLHLSLLASINIAAITTAKLNYFDLSTVNPRAPPQIA